MLVKYFETNRKGNLYKLCVNCRKRNPDLAYSLVSERGHVQTECEKCGQLISSSMKLHQKSWACYNKSVLGGEGGKEELYKFIMYNMHDLTKMQKWYFEEAKNIWKNIK